MFSQRQQLERATVVWAPTATVAIGAAMILINFFFGAEQTFQLVGSSWVRFFPAEQLYDLVLHFAMLTLALAGALLFAAVARTSFRHSEKSAS